VWRGGGELNFLCELIKSRKIKSLKQKTKGGATMEVKKRIIWTTFDRLDDYDYENLESPLEIARFYEPCDCGEHVRHNDGGNYHTVVKIYKLDNDYLVRRTTTREFFESDNELIIIDKKYLLPVKREDEVDIVSSEKIRKEIEYLSKELCVDYCDLGE
jgi:hypothetical protein